MNSERKKKNMLCNQQHVTLKKELKKKHLKSVK